MTQQNAALVEQAAAAAESLEEEAQHLSAAAGAFKLDKDSQPQALPVPAPRPAAGPDARYAPSAPAGSEAARQKTLSGKMADEEWKEF